MNRDWGNKINKHNTEDKNDSHRRHRDEAKTQKEPYNNKQESMNQK